MAEPIRKLVAGVATLTEMDPIIPAAAELGQRTGLPVHLVHAFDVSDPFVDAYLRRSAFPGDPLERFSEGLQARLEGQVGSLGGHGEVHCRAVAGKPVEVLREAAREPHTLLLVRPTRRSRPAAALLGTTAQRVLHDGGGPVLVVRDDLQLRRVLYSVDVASPEAASVVEWGSAIISSLTEQAPDERAIVVVKLDTELLVPGLYDRVAEDAATSLREFVGKLPDGRSLEQRVRAGLPGREIVAEAAEWPADLIVVGTRARTGAARAIMGSVAEVVVRDAPCSVLVIPPGRN